MYVLLILGDSTLHKLRICCHTLARGQPQALSDSGGQTVCPTDKTTRSLPTMLVWKSVKSELRRLPQSTVSPHAPRCSGNSISAHKLMGLGALTVTVSESQRARHCLCVTAAISLSCLLPSDADDVRLRAGLSRKSVRGTREKRKAE